MQKICLIIAAFSIYLPLVHGCGSEGQENTAQSKISVFVGIPPLSFFVERIAGDRADVHVFIGPGQSPVTFEPTARQMAALAEADVFFSVGVPFEEALLPRIKNNLPGLEIVDTRAGIPAEELLTESGHHGHDPHVWLDPKYAKVLAGNIYKTLNRLDPARERTFEQRYRTLLSDLDRLDAEISGLLAPLEGTEIFVYHPAFGYFAQAYGLEQVAIEEGGVAPGSKHLAELLRDARARGVRVIFVQPQFSRTTAEAIAKEIGAEVYTVDPLSADYLNGMRDLARKIHSAYADG